ncbi:hypothetical protein M231_05380 [Tremella mesenterica]|uniref:Uncharacterized protein n=2 Tax=Tremella mesenterica TaxID=5217 RepID=A0A4Q1BIB2_TREME|nr:hypothetical protein M231_05380 [Tremella mesenterica]
MTGDGGPRSSADQANSAHGDGNFNFPHERIAALAARDMEDIRNSDVPTGSVPPSSPYPVHHAVASVTQAMRTLTASTSPGTVCPSSEGHVPNFEDAIKAAFSVDKVPHHGA